MDFEERNGLFIQKSLQSKFQFEEHYIAIRKSEGRIYTDDVVKTLPDINSAHPLSPEWKIRKKSLEKLQRYMDTKRPATILEVGCGNGWLIQNLAAATTSDCCGIDINATELSQAAKLFNERSNLCFVYGNIESTIFDGTEIDMIILASVLQYFSRPNALISNLKKKLSVRGEIHIIDTPFYENNNVLAARQRSEQYFANLGEVAMTDYYFHHTFNSISEHPHTIRYHPKNRLQRIGSALFGTSPFPWIVLPANIHQ